MKRFRKAAPLVRAACVLAAMGFVGPARAEVLGINPYACGPLQNPFGPFDYRTISYELRHRVEDHHFTAQVEQIRAGQEGAIGADIDYTLRTMPNNAHALMAVVRYVNKKHTLQMQGARYTAECYFERALRFMPDDPMPHLIYAIFLNDRGRKSEVKAQLDEAERLRGAPRDFDFDYNLGVLYFDIGAYDRSLVAAKRAYALGAPLPALMAKLKKAGKWNDDPLPAPPEAAQPTSADTKATPADAKPTPADAKAISPDAKATPAE